MSENKSLLDKVAKDPLDKTAKDLLDKTAKNLLDKTAKDLLDKTAKDLLDKTAKDLLDKTAKDLLEKTAKDLLEKTATELLDKTAKDLLDKTAKDLLEVSDHAVKILNHLPDAIVFANEHGEIILINEQTKLMFGYTWKELKHKTIEILIPDELREKHIKHRSNYNNNPKARPMGTGLELQAKRKNGTLITVLINLVPLPLEDIGICTLAVIRRKNE